MAYRAKRILRRTSLLPISKSQSVVGAKVVPIDLPLSKKRQSMPCIKGSPGNHGSEALCIQLKCARHYNKMYRD